MFGPCFCGRDFKRKKKLFSKALNSSFQKQQRNVRKKLEFE